MVPYLSTMSDLTRPIPLKDRALLGVDGPEATGFLNGLLSNDVARARPGQAAYAALLSPQGKFLHDMLVVAVPRGGLLLDGDAARLPDLARRLTMYRLRAKVDIASREGWRCYALPGAPATMPDGAIAFPDPRHAGLGWRLWLPPGAAAPAEAAADSGAYERRRLELGIPDGSRDIEIDKGLLMENHFEALHGVDFAKGCYVGQELTARTKHRGLVKKQLHIVRGEAGAPLPAPGAPILFEGQEAGIMRSGADGLGLALLRLDAVAKAAQTGQPLESGGIPLRAERPAYAGPPPAPRD